jgi:hypothetical protein
VPPKKRKRVPLLQVLALAIAFIFGLAFLSKRLDAQPKGKVPVIVAPLPSGMASGPASAAPAASGSAKAAPPAGSAAPDGKKADDKDKGDKDGKGDSKDKGGDKELPAEAALNTAKVGETGALSHDRGLFKSAFANPDFGKAAQVKVGFVLTNISSYDIKEGTFEATFYLSLTSKTPMPDPLNLIFPNGKVDSKDALADRPTFKLFRVTGTFRSPPDLRRYPFDSQELVIEVNSKGVDQLRLSADPEHTRLDANFAISGWDTKYLEARSLARDMPPRFENDDMYYGRYMARIGIARFGTSAVFSVYVPGFVIVIIGLLAMWVTPDEMEVRSNGGAPMLAGAVLFHFSLIQSLPATSYLTRADKLMIGVYLSLLMNMISTWFFFIVDEEKHDLVFKTARIVVPVLTTLLMTAMCIS